MAKEDWRKHHVRKLRYEAKRLAAVLGDDWRQVYSGASNQLFKKHVQGLREKRIWIDEDLWEAFESVRAIEGLNSADMLHELVNTYIESVLKRRLINDLEDHHSETARPPQPPQDGPGAV